MSSRRILFLNFLSIGLVTALASPVLGHAGKPHGVPRGNSLQDSAQQSMPKMETPTESSTPPETVAPPTVETVTQAGETSVPFWSSGEWLVGGFVVCPAGLLVLRRKLSK